MDNHRKKRIKYRPSKLQSGICTAMGIVFVIVGIFMVIPTFGIIGIVWTLFAVVFTGVGLYQLTGHYVGPEITIEEEPGEGAEKPATPPPAPVDETETRLKKLQTLHKQSLISDAEYEEKRKEILKEM